MKICKNSDDNVKRYFWNETLVGVVRTWHQDLCVPGLILLLCSENVISFYFI